MRIVTNERIRSFEKYLLEQERADATIEKYIRDIRAFKALLCGKTVQKNDVISYKEKLKETYAPASVNSILSSLNSFFVFCEWHELKVKTLKIQKQIFAQSSKELTKEEYKRLLDAAKSKGNRKLYYLMQAICSTGIRISELKYITVESVRKESAYISLKGKMRIVIIPQALCKMLMKYAKEENIVSGSIFVTSKGKPLDRSNIWKLMKNLCEAAGVSKDKVFPHNLRHLFARTYYSLQKDIVRLADVLGHTSINTTRIYTMETGEIHRTQIQKLGLLRC